MQASPLLTDDAPATAPASVEQPAPLITGETPYLVTGVVAVAVVMILVFVLIGRWRIGARSRDSARNTDFFQPAGEGAEITFDDSGPASESAPAMAADEPPYAEPEPVRKKSSPFSGLFARRDRAARNDAHDAPELLDLNDEGPDFAAVKIDHASAIDHHHEPARTAPAADWSAIERESQPREEAEADARWRAMEEERQLRLAEETRRRAEQEAAEHMATAGERHRLAAAQPAQSAHDDIVRTLSEVEEALHVQREAIQAETRSLLDSFARRFSDRLDALAHSVEQRSAHRFAEIAAHGRSADASALDDIARRLDEHRSEVASALGALAKRLDQLPSALTDTAALRGELAELRKSLNGAAAPSAPAVQLADIVQNALAPGGYEFNALLANNRRADCLIRLARPPGPIAIDARFPVEAFHALHERRSAAADSEFRRVALRHIVEVAERLISPGFTADSALLFLPSESMASELHTRFPDVVQDAYRARVWIVSPTSLMATLHTLSAFLRDAPRREQPGGADSAGRRALTEVERLSERIAALEKSAAAQRADPRDLLSANDASEWRPEPATPSRPAATPAPDEERSGDLYTDEAGDTRHQTQARPPFPLR